MVHSKEEMSKWKSEQLDYFRNYLSYFSKDSRKYKELKKNIETLEKYI